ncbi:MAG: DUF2314 domain-containing protein [Roseivivax sp.]|nr:DUF2314 domain-containing protein [Roseivivax sp.]
MSILSLLGKPLVWGAAAAAVLLLEQTGHLGAVMQQVGLGSPAHAAVAGDPAQDRIAQAERDAQSTLPRFVAELTRGGQAWDLNAVRVRVGSGDVWIENIALIGNDMLRGMPSAGQEGLPNAPMQVAMADVIDWAFVKNGQGYGYYTVHASLEALPPAQAAVARSFLADRPLPQGW